MIVYLKYNVDELSICWLIIRLLIKRVLE